MTRQYLKTYLLFFNIIFLLFLFSQCAPSFAEELEGILSSHRKESYPGTLKAIKEKRHLRVLTSYNPMNYFIYQGEEKGYEYEMVKRFAAHLNKKYLKKGQPNITFEMIVLPRGQLIPMLLKGNGDMIASGLTNTKKRTDMVSFSSGYNKISEYIISTSSQPELLSIDHLAGKRIIVQEGSSYFESLMTVNSVLIKAQKEPVIIVKADENLETIDILELVSLGKFDFTVADSNIAEVGENIFENIKIHKKLPLREQGFLAWAVAKKSKFLLEEINSVIPSLKKGSLLGNINIKKYFQNMARLKSSHFSLKEKSISPFDSLLKKYGEIYKLDWRLLASLTYQESRFNPKAINKSGAVGLFQIKESTASEKYIAIPDVKGNDNIENNIHAGVKYLAWIKKRYFDPDASIEEKDKVRFTMAAYNGGPATIIRARNKARKMGLKPNRWFRNVELALLAMKKPEPVQYVSQINKRFIAYSILNF